MAKPAEKLKARILRKQGKSIKAIAALLNVSKSTVSLWCEDVALSARQRAVLDQNRLLGGHRGRIKGTQTQKEKKKRKIQDYYQKGLREVGWVKNRDLLIAGLGLYMGEGNKKGNTFQFSNSDHALVVVIIRWLRECLNVQKKDITCRVLVNEVYKKDAVQMQKEWSRLTGISLRQFYGTVFIRAKNVKVYEERGSYRGTLALRVRRSSELQYRVLGMMRAFLHNTGAQ